MPRSGRGASSTLALRPKRIIIWNVSLWPRRSGISFILRLGPIRSGPLGVTVIKIKEKCLKKTCLDLKNVIVWASCPSKIFLLRLY